MNSIHQHQSLRWTACLRVVTLASGLWATALLAEGRAQQIGFGGSTGGFRITAEQGNSRSIVSSSSSVTMSNGAGGGFFHGEMRPFVTGWVPVVGERVMSPVNEKLARMANGEVPTPRRRTAPVTRRARPVRRPVVRPLDDPPLQLGGR